MGTVEVKKPNFRDLPVSSDNQVIHGEIRLWRAFLDRIFEDAFFVEPSSHEEYEECGDSREWLYCRDEEWAPSFEQVCEWASLDIDLIERIIDHYETT